MKCFQWFHCILLGEEWTSKDGCKHCTCLEGGRPMCATPMCAYPNCEEKNETVINIDGICCPVCSNTKVCRKEGERPRLEGTIWQDDSCTICKCKGDGAVGCVMLKDDDAINVRKSETCTMKTTMNKNCKPFCYNQVEEMLDKQCKL